MFSSWGQKSSDEQVIECLLMYSPQTLYRHPWIPASWILLQLISTCTHPCYADSPLVNLIWFPWYVTHFQVPGSLSS